MPVTTWEFELDGARYNVVLDHSLFIGFLFGFANLYAMANGWY